MDYKKEYDNICQKLMSAYNTTSFVEVKKAIEGIHPELRESEDERIRKEIISALKFANDDGVYDRHIAYLEKQKEQMMKEAVEGVVEDWNPEPHPEITIPLNPEEFTAGDKVKVIVIKED